MKKPLVVWVIGLFLGLSVAPSINANISKEGELVEVTTEICGLGGGKHTVHLTKEEAEEVDKIFENIRYKLNTTDSREEAVELFNDAVVELDKYGLLGGLSIRQAQRLVTGVYQDSRVFKPWENLYGNIQVDNDSNSFCLIAGETSNTYFEGILARLLSFIIYGFYLAPPLWWLFNGIRLKVIGHRIGFGWGYHIPADKGDSLNINQSSGANGWVYTNGKNGVKTWNGSFWGHLSYIIYPHPEGINFGVVFYGVKGFCGIKIGWKSVFYLGFARKVKIGYEYPDI